jgi:hypothetical protein
MATLSKQDVITALARLGQLAQENGEVIELLLFGGSVMVLVFDARQTTRDVDVMILAPSEVQKVREMAKTVAQERSWPEDWLNDAVKGFIVGTSRGPVVFASTGIEVRRPAFEQLLAMKLCAWRDDVDIADAERLLQELPGAYNEVWQKVEVYLLTGRELTAKYAFDDLWENLYGSH